MSRTALLALALAVSACSGTAEVQAPTVEPVDVPAVVDVVEEGGSAAPAALVPSPSETQRADEAAGIEVTLASLISHPTLAIASDSEDQVAVSTGVVVADLLLTAKTSTNEQLITQIDAIALGMKALDAGSDIDSVLMDLKTRVASDSMTRGELVSELELLSGAIIPELEFNGRARIVPLIQAGSWLEATNLLARALKGTGQAAAADALLKQPEVVEYFQKYAMEQGMDVAAPVTETLLKALETLGEVAHKEDSINDEDLEHVVESTQAVLSLL
jgi:hypothetical protein